MLQTRQNVNDAEMIVNALMKKNKRDLLPRDKELKKQALYFSPTYRDFIYKIISNGSLKIAHSYHAGLMVPLEEDENNNKLSRRHNNKIFTDINDFDTLPHELGHAVDFWFGKETTLTKRVIISNGQTLYDIFTEEFESKQKELYQLVMNEYKKIINSNINEKAYDILTSHIKLYRCLEKIPIILRDKSLTEERTKIQNELYKSGFTEVYYQIFNKRCYSILNAKYSPILDALSSKYDFRRLCLDHHTKNYYEFSEQNPVQEFFANVFEAEVTSKFTQFESLIKYLPKSFEAFQKLFEIFYEHIQNNRKFADVAIKKEVN